MQPNLRVLISEDREDDALLVVDELVQSGYRVEWNRVETPEEMRSLLSEPWDLIIADYDLPQFSAKGALEVLKETGHDIPFLIVSGAMREIDAVAGMRAGVHDYLLKDNLTRLGPVVERELREARVRRERRAAEVMLRRQAQVLDQVHDAVIQMDLSGNILKWNRGAERLLGYSEAEMIGRPITTLYSEEDARGIRPQIFSQLSGDQKFEQEVRSHHKSGDIRWLHFSHSLLSEEDGTPYGSVAYGQDVTERRLAEAALRNSEEQYRLLTEALPQMVLLARDGPHPQVVEFCNSQVFAYTGLTAEQLRSGAWDSTIHPEDQQRVRQETVAAQRSGDPYEVEYRIQRVSDGQWRWHLARSTPFRDANRELHWLATIIDMEDQKQAEEALRKAEKLAAVGRLASSIAHEINNPLEAVTNLVYLLQSTPLNPEQQGYAQAAAEELARVSHITNHTLRFHRQSSHPSQVNLADLLDSLLALYHARLKDAGITAVREYKTSAPITGYASELRQVFANLIGNAFDATRHGGKIVLRVQRVREWRNGSEGVRVTIGDTGHGMSPETRKRIFEPFFTTKGINGTGLGLWVSAEIVRKHGGSFRVKTKEGLGLTGTAFSIFFPLKNPLSPQQPLAAEKDVSASPRRAPADVQA
jgi:PAS domain S-box-containing protein